jgi:hypothetical protein
MRTTRSGVPSRQPSFQFGHRRQIGGVAFGAPFAIPLLNRCELARGQRRSSWKVALAGFGLPRRHDPPAGDETDRWRGASHRRRSAG